MAAASGIAPDFAAEAAKRGALRGAEDSASRSAFLVFSEALIYLSYTALVPPRGIAPRSSAYRAGALLLSYGGLGKMVARPGAAPGASSLQTRRVC